MKNQIIFRVFLLALLLMFGSGCVTSTLWSNFNNSNEPDLDADVRLYEAGQQKDLLVVYDEYSERTDSVRPRAYFLDAERNRIRRGKQPHFVSTNLAGQFSPLPVYRVLPETSAVSSPPLYALYSTNTQSFTIYSNGAGMSSHRLPVYGDPVTRVERIALTPLAVTADLTIVGGLVFLWGWSQGCCNDIH